MSGPEDLRRREVGEVYIPLGFLSSVGFCAQTEECCSPLQLWGRGRRGTWTSSSRRKSVSGAEGIGFGY